MALILACGFGLILARRRRPERQFNRWEPTALEDLLWWVALSLALRCVFESVMVSYYLWPALAVALVAACRGRIHLMATATAAVTLTFASQVSWRGPWLWWGSMVVVGLGLTLYAARRPVVDQHG